MEQVSLSVRYTLNRADMFRFLFRAILRNRLTVVTYLFCLTGLGSSVLGAVATPERSVLFYIIFLCPWLCAVTIAYGFLLVLVTAFLTWFGNHRGSLGEHTISLSSEGLNDSTEFSTSFNNWSGIAHVEATGRYVLVFLNDFLCHLIPKRAFASQAAAHEFEQRIRDSVRSAKATATKQP